MNPKQTIARNFAWCMENDDSSFSGQLNENRLWDINEYWILEKALYELVADKLYDEETMWRVFRIFSFMSLCISAHLDINDSYKISNLSAVELYKFRERVQLVFEGYFKREMPSQSVFEDKNPFLGTGNG